MSRLLIVEKYTNITFDPKKLKRKHIVIPEDNNIIPEIDNDWTVYQICQNSKPLEWEDTFEYCDPELNKISMILDKRGNIFYPEKRNLFRAFHLTKLSEVRVVILGQDPYHTTTNSGYPIAEGLSFSVSSDLDIPPSLKNIYKEIKDNYPDFDYPNNGNLTKWSLQGVLMLNTCLTVEPGKPNSHGDLWLPFIVKVFEKISEVRPDCIYCLWGKNAQAIEKYLGKKSIKLISAHPSPFSVKNFYGNQHFIQINNLLIAKGEEPIDWQI